MEIKTIIEWIILIGSCVSALGIIIAFLQRQQKKVIQTIFESDYFRREFNNLSGQIEQLNTKISTLETNVNRQMDDIRHEREKDSLINCQTELINFLSDIENGVPKDKEQIHTAYRRFDYYTNILHGNSYVHDKWVKVMESRKDLII